MLSTGGITPKFTSTGKHSGYETTLYHSGLDEYRHVSAREKYLLHDKIHNVERILDNKWAKELNKRAREDERNLKLSKKELALKRSQKAQDEQHRLHRILHATLPIDDTVDWESLYSRKPFESNKFNNISRLQVSSEGKPSSINPFLHLSQPVESDYLKPIPFLKKVLGQKEKIISCQMNEFKAETERVQKANAKVDAENKQLEENLKKYLHEWETLEQHFLKEQSSQNQLIDELKNNYLNHHTEAVEEYCEIVLGNSEYFDFFTKNYEFQYEPNSKSLVIDFQLPDLSDIPTLTSVNYIASRDEFTEKNLSKTALEKLYDSVVYQISLRTIHEIFEADSADALDIVTFNGIIDTISPSTGNQEVKCILSIQTTKDEFETINLANVDPKKCFKSLKGVAATKLSSITPIKPILNINREDRRFTDHYDVADALDDTTNLAAMDWEDFEHLIRELFSKEFSSDGGEVRVTKASRDGGVDAIAFDPDPIRGGKIVIQAKRYTNIVSVSAVRDLFGTVTSEGANKGILVTTADYGPDAYAFARDKPITLLNGANLLHLLNTHGHKAKIDIEEAKLLAKV